MDQLTPRELGMFLLIYEAISKDDPLPECDEETFNAIKRTGLISGCGRYLTTDSEPYVERLLAVPLPD